MNNKILFSWNLEERLTSLLPCFLRPRHSIGARAGEPKKQDCQRHERRQSGQRQLDLMHDAREFTAIGWQRQNERGQIERQRQQEACKQNDDNHTYRNEDNLKRSFDSI